jgi:glutathione reductase (NADPH)
MAEKSYDLVVIGTGVAGSQVAYNCRAAGWRVAVVDSQPFGGTCSNRGCDAKKILVSAAELVDWNRRMIGRGVTGDGVIDWPALMRFKRTFTADVPQNREAGFSRAGIDTYHKRARFVGTAALAVGDDVLMCRHIVIAAGARPVSLGIPGEEHLTTSTIFLDLDRLPDRIVFVGGGYIAFEFAHIAARAGAKVRIVNRGPRPLRGFDPDLVDRLEKETVSVGIQIENNALVTAVEKTPAGLTVHASSAKGGLSFDADLVVHSAGRVPDIDDLDLETGGVRREAGGVTVNEFLQSTTNPAVYAAGDAAASGPPLTPAAIMEGGIVSRNLLEGNRHRPDYHGIATVVYSIPALASVGLGEEEARAKGFVFDVKHGDSSGWYNIRRVGAVCAGFKVLVEKGSERVLGAHVLGPQADDVINLFSTVVRFGLKVSEIRKIPYAYPTNTYDIVYMV